MHLASRSQHEYILLITPHWARGEVFKGLFQDTLPGFLRDHAEPILFVHIDCDLYSSTAFVLEHVGPRLIPDSILVFDELFDYLDITTEHEAKAFCEWYNNIVELVMTCNAASILGKAMFRVIK